MGEKKERYYNLSEATDELRYDSYGAAENIGATFKLVGKGLFNAVKFTVTEALPAVAIETARIVTRSADQQLENKNLSDEERAKLNSHRERAMESAEILENNRKSRDKKYEVDCADK